MNAILRIAPILGLFALGGCVASRGSTPSPFEGGGRQGSSAEDPIQVHVQNLNFNDITVWAMREGQRIRLGRVTGKTDEAFRVQWNLALPIYFVIDVTGGRQCRTARVAVEPEARVWVSVPVNVGAQPCQIGRR